MEYVLKRHEDGRYVSLPGSEHSYTRSLKGAQKFPTRDAAQRSACENERAVSIAEETGSAQ